MKVNELYIKYKEKYPNHLVILPSGIFYESYLDDAKILNMLFNYNIVNNRVGFPMKIFGKIEGELERNKINYIVVNKEENEYKIVYKKRFVANKYNVYLEKHQKIKPLKDDIDEIYHKLIDKLESDSRIEEIISKIKELVV